MSFGLIAAANDRWASGEINVRTGPGTTFDIMGKLNSNEKVVVFSVVSGWAQILFENVEGYVSYDLLLAKPMGTSAEEEALAQLEKERQEKERLKSRRWHILIIVIGILGTILIFSRTNK